MKKIPLLSIIFLIAFNKICFSQFYQNQLTTFSSRLSNPIKVEVLKDEKGLRFSVYNKSLFPYTVELQFTNLQNLNPFRSSIKRVVNSGYANMAEFSIADKNSSYSYNYSTTSHIGDQSQKPDTAFKYPVPFSEGKQVKLLSTKNTAGTLIFNNIFIANVGDTIFAVRMGKVTSTTEENDNFEKIVKKGSIEVLHEDGTVAVYIVPDSIQLLVEATQKIYPLQPICVIKKSGNLIFRLLQLNYEGSIKQLNMHFDNPSIQGNNTEIITVMHSPEAAQAELSKSEKKKLSKGTLFK